MKRTTLKEIDKVTFEIDPEIEGFLPPLRQGELQQLRENLFRDGLRDPLVVWRGTNILVGGHNRYRECRQMGIEIPPHRIVYRDFADKRAAKEWMLRDQIGSRQLNTFQKIRLAIEVEGERIEQEARARMLAGKKRDPNQNSDGGSTNEKIAEDTGTSSDTVSRVRFLLKHTSPTVIQQLADQEVSINAAYESFHPILDRRRGFGTRRRRGSKRDLQDVLDPTFDALARLVSRLNNLERHIAESKPECDNPRYVKEVLLEKVSDLQRAADLLLISMRHWFEELRED